MSVHEAHLMAKNAKKPDWLLPFIKYTSASLGNQYTIILQMVEALGRSKATIYNDCCKPLLKSSGTRPAGELMSMALDRFRRRFRPGNKLALSYKKSNRPHFFRPLLMARVILALPA